MRTIADPAIRHDLVARLSRLTPDTPRRWGTLTSHEMLCHLGDATAMVLRERPRVVPVDAQRRPLRKALGTRPGDFDRDRARVVDGLERLAAASTDLPLEPAHGFFGAMSTRDWQRWAWKHTEHHLRQFGV